MVEQTPLLSTLALLITAPLLACSGGTHSSGERMCDVLVDCGKVASSAMDTCVSQLDQALASAPERALEECLDCIEGELCSAIDDGACANACDDIDLNAPSEGGDDEPPATGSLSVKRMDSPLCVEREWSPLEVENAGSSFTIDASCGDLDLHVEFPPTPVGATSVCSALNIYGGDSIYCEDGYESTHFYGSATLATVGGVKRLQGSCTCYDDYYGSARVDLDLVLK